jgi:hypothetical protein
MDTYFFAFLFFIIQWPPLLSELCSVSDIIIIVFSYKNLCSSDYHSVYAEIKR